MKGPVKRHLAVAALAVLVAAGLPATAADAKPKPRDLGRETIAPNDGWAAAEGGTTGGADAADEHVHTVETWAELQTAVRGDHPKIVYVQGHIDAWTDASGAALTCEDFNDPEYTLEAYLDAFDPEHWEGPEAGPMAEARERSYAAYRQHVLLRLGSNTTLVGKGSASITHGSIYLESVENVIIRNLGLHDAYDCFPEWRGADWDAEFDNIEISRSKHVWIDHVTIDNGDTHDYEQPHYFGALFDVHDGAIDIVRGSDLVTVSWSHIRDHDKTMLIGNTNADTHNEWDKLRVTLHHNWFENVSQRVTRLRYGQNHLYNNYYTYKESSGYPYHYSLGAGVHSAIYAENNYFHMPELDPSQVIYNWGGVQMHEEGSIFNGHRTDLLGAFNEAHPDLAMATEVDRGPELHGRIDPTRAVPALVTRFAGAGKHCKTN